MIKVQDLTLTQQHNPILQEVSCQFSAGNISVLLGKNGAGKSSLLNCLSGWQSINSGVILWEEQKLKSFSSQQLATKRAVLEQDLQRPIGLTVRDLISLGLEVNATPCSLQQLVEWCDLTELLERPLIQLSGGELQRAHLARVVAQILPPSRDLSGKWLLLDEWASAMDLEHQRAWLQKFKHWQSRGLGIIMIVHDLQLAQSIADEILLLKKGKVFASGSVSEVMNAQTLSLGLDIQVAQYQNSEGEEVWLPSLD